MAIELTESFLAQIAGWEAVKSARSLLAGGKVLSSNWTPPLLKGVVQEGSVSYRAGLVIRSERDLENICTCRQAREWGTICAHSVAVGLHHLKKNAVVAEGSAAERGTSPQAPATARARPPTKRLQRADGAMEGESAEIFIILPPNFAQAVERAKLMLCLEGAWCGGRAPLNALPLSKKFRFSDQDVALLDCVETLAGGDTPAMLMIGTKDFVEMLPLLIGHPRITLGKSIAVNVTGAPWPVPLKATLEPNGEILLTLKQQPAPALRIEQRWGFHDRTLQPISLPESCATIFREPVRLPRSSVPPFLSRDWPQLQNTPGIEANFKVEDFVLEPQAPRFSLHLVGGLAQLQAQLQCAYGVRIMTIGVTSPAEDLWLPDPASPVRYGTRDLQAERAALARLLRVGFTGPDGQGRYQLHGQDRVLNFFAREYPRLQKEWTVTLEERLQRSTAQNLERIEPKFEITSSGIQWFDLGVSFASTSGQKLSAADIQRLVLSGRGYARLNNGKMALIDTGAVEELQEVLLDCAPQQQEGGYRIDQRQAGFIEATLKAQGWTATAPSAWRDRAQQQSGQARMECPPLGALEEVLRPYQKEGAAWLLFLRQNGFGGILADEMGLGKTVQWLALWQAMRFEPLNRGGFSGKTSENSPSPIGWERAGVRVHGEPRPPTLDAHRGHEPTCPLTPTLSPDGGEGEEPPVHGNGDRITMPEAAAIPPSEDHRRPCPSLVVCPASLVFNWMAEAQKFTPKLRVLALHGANRHDLFAQIPQHDLIVTSYALIRRDLERYREHEFDTVVLDEAQHIKNRQTQNAQAVKAIRARHRLVLTGTPLENSVFDLWSIFDFLMPGYLGSAKDFRERYELPITRDRNPDAQSRLTRRLRPFILRRLKHDVAKDLPAKLEQIAYCELTEDQRAVYQQIMEAGREQVLAATGPEAGRGRIAALNALLRLRQVCCDLRLLKLNGLAEASTSGKLDLFGELLEEVLDGGHRVLVFSQFVSMLTLLRERLASEGIDYCYLDGSTSNRPDVISRFQTTETPVFLISLKAGGVGLNLTGADTVIHFDPWWNPAVEAQATDRAHRLGQTRVVTGYKLITRGTVEEKILQLQQRKRDLIQATMGDEEQFVEALSWEEIQELFTG